MKINSKFEKYEKYHPKVPVYCISQEITGVIHRFFDTSPFSPSGRYLALFKMPFEDRVPEPGEAGDIVLVDLQEGTEKIVAQTLGWEQQMGANINWGADDNQIIYNDVDPDTWEVYAVRLNPFTGEKEKIDYGVYHVSPDGLEACTGNPACKWRTQPGYGVLIPEDQTPVVDILSEKEGLFVSDTQTGKGKLLLSMKDIFTTCFDDQYIAQYKDGECYLFHSKYSPSGKKIMFSTRWFDKKYHGDKDANAKGVVRFNVFTCNRDGSNLQLTIAEEHWVNSGHHTTWHPNEEYLTMNIKKDWGEMRFAMATLDGKKVFKVFDDVIGSGHPTFHPNGKFILTDTYVFESFAYGDGTTPIRLVYLEDGKEEEIARINTKSPYQEIDSVLRIDPHPAWDKTNKYVAINIFEDDTRKVFVLDMEKYLT